MSGLEKISQLPHASLSAEGAHHGFNFLAHIPLIGSETHSHVTGVIFVSILLIGFFVVARLKLNLQLQSADRGVVPPAKLTLLNFAEILAEQMYKLTESVLGEKEAPHYFSLIGTLFVFIFSCNILGLIPGFVPPTQDLNTTLALGFFVFITYNAVGFKEHGIAYLKQFLGPVLWLSPLLLVIELISHVFRPFTLGLRLRGNMFGDHLVMSLFSDLVPVFVPVIFYFMGLFVSLVQAFVFCLLTMVYISLSTSHDH